VVIVYPYMGSKAKPKRSWADVPLSELKPREFADGFQPMLDKLEAAGVRLTAMELGNEINTSGYNGDIATSGSGRDLKLSDLNNPNDPEGSAVAAGYRSYIRVMVTLKDLRDHSRLNQHTPTISAGLAQRFGTALEVNLHDTISFFHQNGMDKLVDGYGIHVYPSDDLNRSLSARIASLEEGMFSACRLGGRPCWLTEWGFGNSSKSCPTPDGTRVKLVQAMRSAFQHFASQGELAALIYYDWYAGKADGWAIFRCGALTEAGKLAISPMGTHQIVSQATGLCFSIRGNTNNGGEGIIPYPCGGSTNMEFNFVDQGSGFYSIHTANGRQDLCLNISNGASWPGDGKKIGGPGNLIQWSCGGSSLFDNGLFKLVDLGGGRQQIRVKHSGLCLEDPGSGGTIRQNVCSSSPNQTFTLTE
jgi:hypothetical protein